MKSAGKKKRRGGGSRKGKLNLKTLEIRKILDDTVDFKVVCQKLYELVKGISLMQTDKKGKTTVYIKEPDSFAAKILLEYRFGKPIQQMVHTTPDDKPFPLVTIPSNE